ncbi:hypothetical protein BC938DRAFT_470690 [Jimgerdemannia flammicorona]|uniref:Uncharacterized protein n=1 Tax=Jimgerdemannia flammicorona TaxID=994334 RepID=A0A433Q9L3_9FUNG|nr:hypothetical protein BC938DRAFT_470690 [Jimgerdemannia flammicorona]
MSARSPMARLWDRSLSRMSVYSLSVLLIRGMVLTRSHDFAKRLDRLQVASELDVGIEMVVMLTRNVATARGLVNGALGKVVRFDRTQTKANDMSAPVVVVHFQNGLVEGIHCCEWTVDGQRPPCNPVAATAVTCLGDDDPQSTRSNARTGATISEQIAVSTVNDVRSTSCEEV